MLTLISEHMHNALRLKKGMSIKWIAVYKVEIKTVGMFTPCFLSSYT